jgi:hypothetical protein
MELSFDTPLKFRIQAQDESVQEWTVKLLYAPQVYNSGYELWGNVEGSFNLLPSDGRDGPRAITRRYPELPE